jgi:cytohesin
MLTLHEVLSDFGEYAGYAADVAVTVNSRSRDGESPMHWMATLGDNAAIKVLVQAGADLNAQDDSGNSTLHEASERRQITAVKALIDVGANLLLRDVAGQTPLDVAMESDFRPAIDMLRSHS